MNENEPVEPIKNAPAKPIQIIIWDGQGSGYGNGYGHGDGNGNGRVNCYDCDYYSYYGYPCKKHGGS